MSFISFKNKFSKKPLLYKLYKYIFFLTQSWEDKGVHTFPKGICPKVNVIVRLEYELAYYDSAVHRFNQYTTRIPPEICKVVYLFANVFRFQYIFECKKMNYQNYSCIRNDYIR